MDVTSAVAVQRKVLRNLACPVTRGPIELLPLVRAGGAVKEAVLYSPLAEAVVGRVCDYQIDFVRFTADVDVEAIRTRLAEGSLPADASERHKWDMAAVDADIFEYRGDWRRLDELMCSDGIDLGTIHWTISGACRILFVAHPWSGHAEILVDDVVVHDIDLYEPHTAVPRSVVVAPASHGPCSTVTVRAKGTWSAASMGRQCLFRGCELRTDQIEPARYEKKFGARGAEFTPRFHDMLDAVSKGGLCLDMGGGNRQIDDARYVNLDYAAYDEPDIIGDGLALPFADGTFDLVYSSGVIEHLRDPVRAGAEIHRVTKPGGRALIGMAFMQPIHAEGQHFFNATIWGLQEAFKEFVIDDVYWTGSLSFLTEWMIKCVGLDQTGDPEDLRGLQDILNRLDRHISYDRLKYIASSVWIAATK